jgi:AbrB family looped-hinge helix DNA binding protein
MKFQVTIPKDAREFLKLKVGERIVFKSENGKLVLQRA